MNIQHTDFHSSKTQKPGRTTKWKTSQPDPKSCQNFHTNFKLKPLINVKTEITKATKKIPILSSISYHKQLITTAHICKNMVKKSQHK